MNRLNIAGTLKRRSLKATAAAVAALCALTAAAALFARSASPVFANSGPPWEEGVSLSGIHSVHENSVLQVESEKLIFKIGTPPYELKDGEKYDSTVTAEYNFFNPTDETVNTQMAFPVSLGSDYYSYIDKADADINNRITVNGQPVEYETRHTYGRFNSFEEDVTKIRDDYIVTDFFSPELPVTQYVFTANVGDGGSVNFRAKIPQSSANRYFCNTDGDYFQYGLSDGYMFSIYVLGEDDGALENLGWTATRYDYRIGRNVPADGSVTLEKKYGPTFFKDYVFKTYDPKCGISEIDWYNAMFELINKDGVWAGSGETPQLSEFTEWYVYETTVAPRSGFTNAVTAYLYPTVYFNYTPYLYEYLYYLSPAQGWASFGDLTIEVQTQSYMQEGVYYDPDDEQNSIFKKTDTGYLATFTELPAGELSFTMCSAETPESGGNGGNSIGMALAIIFSVLLGVPLITALTILTVFLVKRRKRKKRQAALAANLSAARDEQTIADPATLVSGNGGDDVGELGSSAPEEGKDVYCTSCGRKIAAEAAFCPYCGGAVPSAARFSRSGNAGAQNLSCGSRPPAANADSGRVNGLGIAGFAVSVCALLLCFAFFELGFVLCLTGFGLSLAGVLLRKKYRRVYGLAVAGLAVSSVLIVFVAVVFFLVIGGIAAGSGLYVLFALLGFILA